MAVAALAGDNVDFNALSDNLSFLARLCDQQALEAGDTANVGLYLGNALDVLSGRTFASAEELQDYSSQVFDVVSALIGGTPSFSSAASVEFSSLIDKLGDVLALSLTAPEASISLGLKTSHGYLLFDARFRWFGDGAVSDPYEPG
jgi:hypothetical protein